MASTIMKGAAIALALAHPTRAAVFPENIFNRSEIEAMSMEKRGSMAAYTLWDAATIPYILAELPHDLSNSIRDAMRQWEQSTCIRFVPKTDQKAWVNFKKYDQGCYAQQLGAPFEGEMIVNLDYPNGWQKFITFGTYKACLDAGTPAHELGHVIGLTHEHQRPDRDRYIRILPDRIRKEYLSQFDIWTGASTSVPFDYNSIMLYDTKAWAKDTSWTWFVGEKSQKHTMETVTDKNIDPWDHPTDNDFKAVNNGYGCEEYYTRKVPDCLAGSLPANGDFSSYSFILDRFTEEYMRKNGYTHVGVRQDCHANRNDMATTNWGFTTLNGWGPNAQYKVTTGRCKKDYNRHASGYEVALCKADNYDACDIRCGERRVCPADASGKGVDSKAVDVTDNTLWVCHPH